MNAQETVRKNILIENILNYSPEYPISDLATKTAEELYEIHDDLAMADLDK